MKKSVIETPPQAPHLIEDHLDELRAVHGDAVQLVAALEFMDAQSGTIDREGREGAEARGGYASLVGILATTSKALADRIEELEYAITRTLAEMAR